MSDWKAVAEAAWRAPGWREAAEEYHRNRPKGPLVTGRTFEETCRLADGKLAADRKAGRRVESAEILRARRLLADDVSFERAYAEINYQRGSDKAEPR